MPQSHKGDLQSAGSCCFPPFLRQHLVVRSLPTESFLIWGTIALKFSQLARDVESQYLAKFWSPKIRLNELILNGSSRFQNVERILDYY